MSAQQLATATTFSQLPLDLRFEYDYRTLGSEALQHQAKTTLSQFFSFVHHTFVSSLEIGRSFRQLLYQLSLKQRLSQQEARKFLIFYFKALTYARQRNSIEVWQHQRRPSNQYQTNAVKEKVYVDLSPYWPAGKSIASVYEQLLLEGNKIDRRTLSSAKSGLLTKSEFATLVKLRDWVRKETGRSNLTIDDLLRFEPEEDK